MSDFLERAKKVEHLQSIYGPDVWVFFVHTGEPDISVPTGTRVQWPVFCCPDCWLVNATHVEEPTETCLRPGCGRPFPDFLGFAAFEVVDSTTAVYLEALSQKVAELRKERW